MIYSSNPKKKKRPPTELLPADIFAQNVGKAEVSRHFQRLVLYRVAQIICQASRSIFFVALRGLNLECPKASRQL